MTIILLCITIAFITTATVATTNRSLTTVPTDVINQIVECLECSESKSFAFTNHQNYQIAKSVQRQQAIKHYQQALNVLNISINDIEDNFKLIPPSPFNPKLFGLNGMVRGLDTSSNEYYLGFECRDMTDFYDYPKGLLFYFNSNGTITKSVFLNIYLDISHGIDFLLWCKERNAITDNQQNVELLKSVYSYAVFTIFYKGETIQLFNAKSKWKYLWSSGMRKHLYRPIRQSPVPNIWWLCGDSQTSYVRC